MTTFLDVKFTTPKDMKRKAEIIRANLAHVVASTTLLAITKIAMDTPVDTGRARASIAGEFADVVDISGPAVSAAEVAKGKRESLTRIDPSKLEAVVGSNLEYLPHLEFGHRVVVGSMGRKIAKKDAKTGKVQRVPGVAMFRKNIPAIREDFRKQARLAVTNGLKGLGMGGDE